MQPSFSPFPFLFYSGKPVALLSATGFSVYENLPKMRYG